MDQGKVKQGALALVARSVSTSYSEVLTGCVLANILRSGTVPACYAPHLMALLEEVPPLLVERAISEASTPAIPSSEIRTHLSRWSKQWLLPHG